MEETSGVRLVRCPKCGNILPELPNFSVFQCGGCLAVLQAKPKEIADNGLSEASEEGERRGVDEKGENNVSSENVIKTEVKNDDMFGREEEGIRSEKFISNGDSAVITEERGKMAHSVTARHGEESISNGHSSVKSEGRGKMAHSVISRQGEETIGTRFSQGRRIAFHDNKNYRQNLRNSINDPAQRNQDDVYLSEVVQKFANYSLVDEIEGIRPTPSSRRTNSVINDRSMERNGSIPSWRNDANSVQQGRFVRPPYSDEGPSNYCRSSYRGYGEQMRYPEGSDGLARVAHLENDRAELLKKLDELKEQISKSGELAERPGEGISAGRRPPTPPDPYSRQDAYMPEGFQFHFEKQARPSDKYFPVPPNLTRGHDRAPSMQRPDLSSNDSYPPNYFPNSLAGDVYHPHMSRRPLYQPSHHYSQRTYMGHFPNGHTYNQDLFMPHPYETTFHQLSCSCSHCMNKNRYGHGEIPTHVPSIMRSRNDRTNAAPYLHINSTAMGPKGYSSAHDQQQFTRPPSLMNYENGGFNHQRARQVIVSKGGARVYRPMAQGAPFITCLRCFELLKLPVKVLGTNQGKVKCGACSSIFELEFGTKGIALSVSEENKHALEDVSYFSDDMTNDKFESAHDWLKHDSEIPFYGGDHHSDSGPKQSLDEQWSSSREFEKRRVRHISCSSSSENEKSPDNVIVREDDSHQAKLPVEDDVLPSLEDSLRSDDSANLYGEVKKAESMGIKNSVVEQVTSRHGSMKEAPVASEMDISVSDYTNSGISHNSTEVSKEVSKSRINKFAGLLKRSFKDFARSGNEMENEKPSILINGHMIPDRLLKKAEKVAGPVQHGEYWYDYKAGFWGVMGHPCLGIIPPRIEEFKYPMLENCSNGDTKVFVNGRELHHKDLDLLSSRGLPITRHKYYLIEISGKVVDEQTGEELDSLGKLAPTVQRVGHGFGMKITKSIAQGV